MNLDDYITHLENESRDLDAQLNELHVEEWKRPAGQALLRELDLRVSALQLVYGYKATNGMTSSMPNRDAALG